MQGLGNLGNTCYINTFVQCIGHVSCLREYLIGNEHVGVFSKELQDVLQKMWKQNQSLLPKRFVSCIQQTFGFGVYEQHDLNELVMMCYDKIACEDNSQLYSVRDVAMTDARNNSIKTLCARATEAWEKYHKNGSMHHWTLMTEGLQVQQVQCLNCKACYHNFEPFTTINIDLNDDEGKVSLEDKVASYFDAESLQEWKCDQCKSVHPCEKVIRMWKMPKVISIVLKRFRYSEQKGGYVKIRTSITIPQTLRFGKKQILTGQTHTYSLRSVALHHGSMEGGHYTCLGLVDDTWYHYDDINVHRVTMDASFDSSEAYVLMFERS